MSGIKNRIEGAMFHWDNERREGAFLMALIVVAAIARRRYPKMNNREGFEQFLRDCHTV
jgi:hypothetical protein